MDDRMERQDTENIKVVIRVRPLNEQERGRGDRQVLRCLDDGKSLQVSSMCMEDFGRSSTVKNFSFTACVDEDTDQEAFYEQSGIPGLVNKALDGYSATLLAYGQTGSGKTYSVSGAEHVIVDESYSGGDPREGVVPRAAREIYRAVQEGEGSMSFSVKAACFEIYNEQVLDLLNPAEGQLAIRESKSQGFFVENLLVVECHSVSDLMEVFKEGMRNRHVGAHTMNRDSSRSHSLLVIYVDSTCVDPNTGEEVLALCEHAYVH
jgi:kinesin family protein 12